eukprot:6176234-Pleurochrysis_carterae.AAC.1
MPMWTGSRPDRSAARDGVQEVYAKPIDLWRVVVACLKGATPTSLREDAHVRAAKVVGQQEHDVGLGRAARVVRLRDAHVDRCKLAQKLRVHCSGVDLLAELSSRRRGRAIHRAAHALQRAEHAVMQRLQCRKVQRPLGPEPELNNQSAPLSPKSGRVLKQGLVDPRKWLICFRRRA